MTTTPETLARARARSHAQEERKRELEKMAKEAASLTPSVLQAPANTRGMATADSSGFVDLAAFSDVDPHWIDRALAAAQARVDEEALDGPVTTARGVVLSPRTLAPVALEALVEKTGGANRRPSALSRHRAAIAFVAWTIAVGGVSAAIAIVGRDARNARATAATTSGLADAIVVATAPAITAAPEATTDAKSQAATATAPASSMLPKSTLRPPPRATSVGASSPVATKKSAPPPQVKAPPAAPVNRSLLDIMKASAQAPNKPKK